MIRKQEATGKTVDEARAKACALLKGQKLVFGFTQFSKIKKTEDDHC